jgi:predicted glycoside hydrolase/deacetylase ChbG (UPF0249 family)
MRALIVNADDLGASMGVNRGIARAHDEGVVTSASLMVCGPAAAEGAAWARTRPQLSVGLHLDLAEWEFTAGAWLPRYIRVDTVDADAVRTEVDRQLGAFLRLTGALPTHLDSHQHVHRDEPVASVLAEVGARLGVTVRDAGGAAEPRVRYRGDFYGQTGKGESYWEALTLAALIRLLDTLTEGVTELGCHPGYMDDLESTYRLERETETRVLCEPELRREIDIRGIVLTAHAPELRRNDQGPDLVRQDVEGAR